MVALLRTSDAPPIVNLFEFGIPMFVASATDPLRQIRCTMPWGVCAPSRRSPLRVPDAAVPNNGSDGSMVIIDAVNHRTIELWQAQRQPNGDLSASWGSINDLHGTGHTGAGGSGSAISRVAGVVRLDEFASGTIPHALAVSSSYACRDRFRPPANQTDGISDLPACLPEGTRLQLDPTIDLNSISGLTPGEQIIGRTLQMYGAYVVDRGGAPLAFAFQRAPDANSVDDPGTVYRAAGLSWDYFGLRKLPWDRLQVLARWDGR